MVQSKALAKPKGLIERLVNTLLNESRLNIKSQVKISCLPRRSIPNVRESKNPTHRTKNDIHLNHLADRIVFYSSPNSEGFLDPDHNMYATKFFNLPSQLSLGSSPGQTWCHQTPPRIKLPEILPQ
jgi:hypothetical protein